MKTQKPQECLAGRRRVRRLDLLLVTGLVATVLAVAASLLPLQPASAARKKSAQKAAASGTKAPEYDPVAVSTDPVDTSTSTGFWIEDDVSAGSGAGSNTVTQDPGTPTTGTRRSTGKQLLEFTPPTGEIAFTAGSKHGRLWARVKTANEAGVKQGTYTVKLTVTNPKTGRNKQITRKVLCN